MSQHPAILLDTHVLLWTLLLPEEISTQNKTIISKALDSNQLYISSITLWEIAMLKQKKRINVFTPIHDFLASISQINGLIIQEISPEIAAESTLLVDDFHGDPADRIIAASALVQGASLMTRDKQIIHWAKKGNLKFIET